MPHDSTKVALGSVGSSKRHATCEDANPATFKAGLAVRRKSDGGLRLDDDSTAQLIGISLGADLSDASKTSVCRKGLSVPLRQKTIAAVATFTIGTFADLLDGDFDSFTVGDVEFVAQAGAATPGDATFRAATSDGDTATSLAAQINAHEDTKDLVEAVADGDDVVVTAKEGGSAGNAIVALFNDNTENAAGSVDTEGTLEGGSDGPAVYGQVVYVNDDGLACESDDGDAVATNATYASAPLTGVELDGTEVWVANVDMVGGL